MIIFLNYDILDLEIKNECFQNKYNIVEVTGGIYEVVRNSRGQKINWYDSY